MIASLIASFASGETMHLLRRARRAAIAFVLAGAAILCALGFFIGAGYIWTARRLGSLEATLAFGVGFLVLAGIVLLIHKLMGDGGRRQREIRRRNKELTAVAAASALAVLPTLLRSRVGVGVLLMPAAALLAHAIYRENAARPPRDTGPRGEG